MGLDATLNHPPTRRRRTRPGQGDAAPIGCVRGSDLLSRFKRLHGMVMLSELPGSTFLLATIACALTLIVPSSDRMLHTR
eukprot:353804-Hanusia_phi.AAC.1